MSPRASDSEKPGPDVYVTLLFISVASLAIGCLLLWKSLEEYGFQFAP